MASKQKHFVLSVISPLLANSFENMHLFKNALDKVNNKLTIIQLEESNEEQYSSVEAIVSFGAVNAPVINAEMMDLMPKLRIISSFGAGYDHIDVKAATERGIKVGNTKYEVADSTADLAFALLLSAARKIVVTDAICRNPSLRKEGEHSYRNAHFGQEVTGATLGIVGLGSIGTAIAQRSKAFRMNTLYYSRTRKEDVEQELGIVCCDTLKDLLKQADFVILSACYTQQTHHMIGATELSYMKPTSILINIARGGLINQDDLVTALQTGQIYAAALDVTVPEPLPRDHPLLTLSNVILTPHIGTATGKARASMVDMMFKNLMAGLKGEPLPSPAN